MTFDTFRLCIANTAHVDVNTIQYDTSIRDDLGIDSLQMVNLLFEIIETFQLELGQIQGNEDLQTVGNLYRLFGGVEHEQII